MGVLGQTRDQGAASVTPTASAVADKTGFFENVGAGFRQAVAGVHSTQVGQAIYEKRAYDEIIKALAAEGEQGEDTLTITATPTKVKRPFRNPYVSGPWENLLNPSHNFITDLYGGGDRAEAQQIWAALQRVRQRKPDLLKGYSDEAALHALTEKRRQQDQAAAQVITSRAGTMGTVGQFVGGMGGSVASLDPENAVGAGFGTAAGKTVARTVIKRSMEGAAVNAAASAVALPGQIADAQRLGQEFTPEDALHQIGEGAAIGAVFGGAHVIIPKVAGAAGKVAGAVADKVTSAPPVRDALIAASIRAGTINDHSVLNEWMRTHNPGGIVDTTTPDERAAAHTILRDAANRETSPLHPQHAGENDGRLNAVAHALGVDMSTPDLPSPAPIQTGTVRDREAGGRRLVAYEEAVHAAEGTGKNPESSADGHFQFTEGTWLDYAPRVTDTKGKSRAEILALRHDLPTARKAEQLFRADNGRYLRERGLEDSPGNLSLAHFLGPSDAAKTLKADPAAPIETIIDPRSFRSNRKLLEGKSASEVVAWAHKRIGAAVDLPVARADAVPDADGLDAADYSDTPYERATFTPDDIETDAALMQYKSGGDEEGITGKLKDVTAWDPLMSSEILVWEGGDGRRVVVDGHQRVGLAKRLSTESEPIELPALVVREADGITAAQARVLGALRNINLGTGSLIDNARVLRDAPQSAELLKGAENRREVAGLARLSYEAFGAAINGVIDPRIAAEIGKHAPDPSTHMALAGMLAKENVRDPREASVIIRQALADGFGSPRETQIGLFGAEPQQSLYVPIARILAVASKKLREEKRTFRVLSEKAGRIEEAGNVLDRTANEERVMSSDEALAIIERTAHSAGPVRDALIAAARAELSGSRRSDAVNGFLDALAGIDLRAAAAGASEDGAVGQSFGEAGIRDAAAETDRLLSDRDEPSLYDHAVTARAASEPFSDPVGEAAKAQTELLEHDLRMEVGRPSPPLGPENFAASTFYYDGGARERRVGDWAPKDDQVSLANFEEGLKPGTSVVELRRVKFNGANLTWVAVVHPSIDAKFGDRRNVAKVGIWLRNAEITDPQGLLSELDRLSAWAADPKNARDVASSDTHGAEVAALLADLPRYTKTIDAHSVTTAFGPPRFPERETLSVKGLDAAASEIEALSHDPNSKPLAIVTIDHAAESITHEIAPETAGFSPTKLAEMQGQATPGELHALALANQPELARVSAEIASETGATVENPGVKSLSRIQEKVDLEGYDHAGQIKDATRIAFVVQSPEQAAIVAERIRGAYPEHADKGIQTLPANGYTDHKIIVRFANGAVGEVQIIPDVIYTEKFKKGLGKLYREARSSADRAEQERLNGLQREGYAAALAGSAFRDWSMNEKSASGNSLRALTAESGVPSVEDLPTSAGASRQPDDGFQANARPDLGSDQSTATSRSSTSNNSMLMGETSSPDIGNTTEIVNEADPNIANRQRQEAQLKAASPMRSIAEQQGTMGLGLFDVADEPTFRLSEADDDGKPLSEIMRDAEEDEVAAKALRDCLKPGEGA